MRRISVRLALALLLVGVTARVALADEVKEFTLAAKEVP